MFLLFITCLWETFCCIRAHHTNISGLICRCFKYQGGFFRWIPKALARKLSNTQLPGHSWGCLLLLGTPRSLFPAAEQVISSAILSLLKSLALPGAQAEEQRKKNLYGYYTSSASLTTSGNFLLGLFFFLNLHDRYLYIPVKSTRYF